MKTKYSFWVLAMLLLTGCGGYWGKVTIEYSKLAFDIHKTLVLRPDLSYTTTIHGLQGYNPKGSGDCGAVEHAFHFDEADDVLTLLVRDRAGLDPGDPPIKFTLYHTALDGGNIDSWELELANASSERKEMFEFKMAVGGGNGKISIKPQPVAGNYNIGGTDRALDVSIRIVATAYVMHAGGCGPSK
jgi:hypothetical protein